MSATSLRKRASEIIARFPLPSSDDEHWRWFRPEALAAFGEEWYVPGKPQPAETLALEGLPYQPDGVVRITGIGQLEGEGAVAWEVLPPVAPEAMTPEGAWFSGITALQLGLAEGVRIIPKGRRLLLHRIRSGEGGMAGVCELRIGKGQEVEIVEYCSGKGRGVSLPATRIVLEEQAKVRFVRIQQEEEGAHLARLELRLGKKARLSGCVVELGAQLSRLDVDGALEGEGAALALGVALAVGGRRRSDVHLFVDHRAVRTQSRIEMRALASGRGQAIYDGLVRIEQGADQADADQQAKGLLLSDRAEIDAKPELEIEHDDVRAAHGCAIGGLDEKALFYLRSRGIPEVMARAMLMEALMRPALANAPKALADVLSAACGRAVGLEGGANA